MLDVVIVHVLDRYHDDNEVFKLIEKLGDKFVIRLKKVHKSDQDDYGHSLSVADLPNQVQQSYTRLTHLDKEYTQVSAHYELSKWKSWDILRVSLYQKDGRRVFKEPMLLATNLEITEFLIAFLVFELYLHRWKIESVFRSLKQVLGWEDFLIQDWESIRNLISLAFFIGGYFYEIKDQLTEDKNIICLAELGGGRGKVTRGYILKGIAKVLEMKQTEEFLEKNKIDSQTVDEVIRKFTAK